MVMEIVWNFIIDDQFSYDWLIYMYVCYHGGHSCYTGDNMGVLRDCQSDASLSQAIWSTPTQQIF